jgi:hypothetical protein
MESVSRPLRSRFHRRLAYISDLLVKLVAIFTPRTREVQLKCPRSLYQSECEF